MNGWIRDTKFWSKTGEPMGIEEVKADLKKSDPLNTKVDLLKSPTLYGEAIDYNLILLGLTADTYPVAIEKRARKLKKILSHDST